MKQQFIVLQKTLSAQKQQAMRDVVKMWMQIEELDLRLNFAG